MGPRRWNDDTAILLLSEPMGNAVHRARVPPDRRIAVRAAPAPGGAARRGPALVEMLADRWNVQPRPYGIDEAVRFELRVTKACVNSSDQWPDLDVGFAPWTVTWDS
ncbi:hypothetical protein SAMN05216252_106438 [Actinacidiphila glaucinigra]|uniref:Uncharacterized protein n=1 Tax=Actinacidiphila glaucinigra TaxID=235986 RepID=A0A239FDF6_9ACTN|nr:hypothetical protein SAMN05216252_106438 [Actinacidiphila glaucinigra]